MILQTCGVHSLRYVAHLILLRNPPQVSHHPQIGLNRQLRVERGGLRQISNQRLNRSRLLLNIETVHPHHSVIGLQIAGQDLKKCGLTGPVGPQEANDLARLDGERDILKRTDGTIRLTKLDNIDHHLPPDHTSCDELSQPMESIAVSPHSTVSNGPQAKPKS